MSDEGVRCVFARVNVSPELLADVDRTMFASSFVFRAHAPEEIAQWEAGRPERVRRNILWNLADVMPGKRPGRFVRAR